MPERKMSDAVLLDAIAHAEKGQVDADLGAGGRSGTADLRRSEMSRRNWSSIMA